MPTGACGINCDVCKLRLMGICSSCGSGISAEAGRKLDAQRRIFGSTCTILECASMNRIEYCLRDCASFPCENFAAGPYPFSQGFIDMQGRRRYDLPPALDWNNRPVHVPDDHWAAVAKRDIQELCNFTLAGPDDKDRLVFTSVSYTHLRAHET